MLNSQAQQNYLSRIERGLEIAAAIARDLAKIGVDHKGRREAIAAAEKKICKALRASLVKPGEGYLSEEDVDDQSRLRCQVTWVVDPIDGTLECIDGLPEWSISVGLVVNGTALAGGICNPTTGELFLGSRDLGMTYNKQPARACDRTSLHGAVVLASRQECLRGDWSRFYRHQFTVRPMGSIAYKLALVAAGLADATWTLSPKNEWDVVAGVALVHASGGRVGLPGSSLPQLNRSKTLLPGLVASGEKIWEDVNSLISIAPQ